MHDCEKRNSGSFCGAPAASFVRQRRMDVPNDQQAAFRYRMIESISMERDEAVRLPSVHLFDRQMAKLASECAVVIAPDSCKPHAFCQRHQRFFYPLPFGLARTRRMNNVTQKNDLRRMEFITRRIQFLLGAVVGKRPQFATPALCPAIPKVDVGHNQRTGRVDPHRTGRVCEKPLGKQSCAAQTWIISAARCSHAISAHS